MTEVTDADIAAVAARRGTKVVVGHPRAALQPASARLLDGYVTKLALKIGSLTFTGLLGIFYISTFIDMSDKLFKGQTTGAMMAQFFYYKTPEFVFFIIPLTVLIGAMVTVGILTKNSELVVMQACGISLYRCRRAAGLPGGPRQRRDVPAAGSRAAVLEPEGRRDSPRHPRRLAAHLRRRQPEVARRARRQHLQLHVLRHAAARAERPVDLRVQPVARRADAARVRGRSALHARARGRSGSRATDGCASS